MRGSRTIVCVSMSEWGDVPHNSVHLMRQAHAAGYRVLYVESIGLRSARAARRDLVKIARRLRRMIRILRRVDSRFWVLTPFAIPIQGSASIERLNQALLYLQIALATAVLRLRPFIYWCYLPFAVGIGRRAGASRILYYRTDDYTAFPHVNRDAIARSEEAAIAEADLCVAAAHRYLDAPFDKAKRAIFAPNAVDTSHYADAVLVQRPLAVHAVVMGTLDSWLATELLESVFRDNPDWRLTLAGPIRTDVAELMALRNVKYLGVLPYENLPSVLSAVSVGLIPFRMGDVSAGATPGKLFQYLAAGLPVVATPFLVPEALGLEREVFIAPEMPTEFAAAIANAAADVSLESQLRRAAAVATHSWEARFKAIESTL